LYNNCNYLGDRGLLHKTRTWLINFLRLDKKFQNSGSRLKRVIEKYGIHAIAFITPVLLTPVGGSVIAMMMGGSRRKIVKYMFASAIFWGFTISFLFEKLGTRVFGL